MKIPFFPNTGDGTHCFQAVLMMALAVVMPGKKFTYEQLDWISQKQPGKWTWPTAAMLWMLEQGLEIGLVEQFDYKKFAEEGERYLIERYGEEVGRAQIEHSDVAKELKITKRFVELAPLECRVPSIRDIKEHIEDDAVVIVNLNAAALHEMDGYSGHFVTICGVDKRTVTLHDPGLPPHPNLKVPIDRFEKAWGYPTGCDKNLLFIKGRG